MLGKSVLITGATGLIGTYFIYSLLELNKISTEKTTIRIIIHRGLPEHLQHLPTEKNVEIYKGDLQDLNFCASLPSSDYIIHGAGYAQPLEYKDNPMSPLRLNAMTTDVMFKKLNPDGRLLFLSSCSVYTGSEDFPYTEKSAGRSMPDHPRACYIEGKRCGETICHAWENMGKSSKIARIGFVYGPGVRASERRVLWDFIRKGLNGKIELIDEGKTRREYFYVADAVADMWRIFLHGKDMTYNIDGASKATSIRELAQTIGKLMNVPVVLPQISDGYYGAREGEVCIDKLKAEFGERDYVPLEEGLRRTIQWYESNIVA